MKAKYNPALILVLLLLQNAYAHGGIEDEQESDEGNFLSTGNVAFAGISALAIFVLVVVSLGGRLGEQHKKILFACFAVLVAAVTFYFAGTTIYTNAVSYTKGPVHWHADIEIFACDKKIEFVNPEGSFNNKIGSQLLHEHNDNRIHVEGVLKRREGASLGAFFRVIGGSISDDSISVPTNSGTLHFDNGDECNGVPARLSVFVNEKRIDNPDEYAISPYSTVPPGDIIKIIFTEK